MLAYVVYISCRGVDRLLLKKISWLNSKINPDKFKGPNMQSNSSGLQVIDETPEQI